MDAPEARPAVVLRFSREGETVLTFDAEGTVRSGGEVIARLEGQALRDRDGVVVAVLSDDGPLRTGDGAELPFVILPDGTLRMEGQAENASIASDGELRYPALGAELHVRVDGATPQNRRVAMLLVLFQSGFLTARFREGVLRAKAREAERNLGALLEGAASLVRTGRAIPAAIGPTPAALHCDEARWPEDADAGFATLGFAPERARFQYALRREGAEIVVTARGDLDCDGVPSAYERRAAIEGRELVIGEMTSENPLE